MPDSPCDAEDLVSPPWMRWGVGAVVALALSVYGVHCVAAGRMWLPGYSPGGFGGSDGGLVVGGAAYGMGIAYLALGAFLHFRFFWEGHPRLWRLAGVGQAVSLLAVLCGAGYAMLKMLESW